MECFVCGEWKLRSVGVVACVAFDVDRLKEPKAEALHSWGLEIF